MKNDTSPNNLSEVMAKLQSQVEKCQQAIDQVRSMINNQKLQSQIISYTNLYNELYTLIPLIPNEFSAYRDRLRDKILPNLKTKDQPGSDNFGRPIMIPNNGINPYSFGDAIATVHYLSMAMKKEALFSIWDTIHPNISNIAKERFDNGHYADAVEAAFKEVNVRVKKIVKDRTGNELDGANLMRHAFSADNPIIKIGDLSNETGRNVQRGYMDMFAGAMIGIRNPKAHNNQTITQSDAIRKLHFSSMLMYKIDRELQ